MYNFNPLLHCSKTNIDNKVFKFDVLCDNKIVCSFDNLVDASVFKNNLQNKYTEYKYN